MGRAFCDSSDGSRNRYSKRTDPFPYIFDRFYKANTKENKNGSGLGLAKASEIAKRHQTEIHVQSDSSETTFEIIFHKSE